MAWHKITDKKSGESQIVASLDGIDQAAFDVVEIRANRAPGEFQTVDDQGRTATDLDAVKTAALAAIDREQALATTQFADMVAAITTIQTWADVKRAERDIETGEIPANADLINERYPFLAAIAFVANLPIQDVLPIAKAEVWPQMVEVALFAARAMLARRDVRNAASPTAVASAAQVEIAG